MRTGFGCTAVVTAALTATAGWTADRLNDKQLTQLIESIDEGFDHWKDDLERRNMDDAVIKSAAGNVDVREFVNSMEKDIDVVKDKLGSSNAAGTEVTALLRRASDVERRYAAQSRSEAWKTLSGQFSALAGAYGLGWPVDASATAQRKMDQELATEAKRLADSVDRLREGALDAASDAKRPEAERKQAESGMLELKKAAEQLESNLKDHSAVTGDATRVLELSSKATSFARGVGPMKPEATSALTTVESTTRAIAVAFGRPSGT